MSGERRDHICATCRLTVATGFRDLQALSATFIAARMRLLEQHEDLVLEMAALVGLRRGGTKADRLPRKRPEPAAARPG